jgi:hypothetical protein
LLRLRQAERAGRTEPRLFYDQAAAALAGYLGDRFNLPEISVTADSIERTMLGRAVAEGAVKETIAVLEECNFGRFVSASAAPERRHALSARIRATIDALESAQV